MFEVSVLTKGGRRSQIQTTSPTIRYRPHITPNPYTIDIFDVSVLTKGGGVYPKSRQLRPLYAPIDHTSLLLNRFEVSVLTKGGFLPPFPPPVGKAGFDVWVLTKGGLVCIATCRPVRTVGSHHPVVHAHHLGRYAQTSGACVYRYGPVTRSKTFLLLLLLARSARVRLPAPCIARSPPRGTRSTQS